jgi:MFS family permease
MAAADRSNDASASAAQPSTLVEAIFRREVWPWGLLGITSGLVEGATVAVLVKRGYAGVVPTSWINLAVALVSGAPALANISSFAWANLAHGRARVGVLVTTQALFAVIVGLIAFVPLGALGLALTLASVIVARLMWAGILTVRAAVWTANYPRSIMARMTARLVLVSTPGIAVVALLAGYIIDRHPEYSRWLYALAALCGVTGAWLYRQVRVRREYQLLAAEADVASSGGGTFNLNTLRQILKADPHYRQFMFWMSLYGAGNLMCNAQLVVVFTDRMQLPGLTQIMLLTVLPLLVMPLSMGWWARQFDGGHVIQYRSRQCWVLVASIIVSALGVATHQSWLLWPASVLSGIGYAGASLGWNLGHNDFATLGNAQHYMGVHVTLTGVRGLIAPPLGMLLYEGLEALKPGTGAVALLVPVMLVTVGGLGFVSMQRQRTA